MHATRLSLYPHLSWLSFRTTFPAGSTVHLHRINRSHCLFLAVKGDVRGRWVYRYRAEPDVGRTGDVRYTPADGEPVSWIGATDQGFEGFMLVIPPVDADAIAAEEGVAPPGAMKNPLAIHDPAVRECVGRLASGSSLHDDADHKDEAARRLLLRLSQLCGSGVPDWHDDASVFDRRMLHRLVEHIDAHLSIAPSLSDMALLTGLSPSHFARKFRQSTGLSLHRFVNRRRILASLDLLQEQSKPLAHIALELGFGSQTHFTSWFGTLMGMTPAKYRKHHRRIVV